MVYSLGYRRPPHTSLQSQISSKSKESLEQQDSRRSEGWGAVRGVPEALSFEKIVGDSTCSPCTVGDFMNYLLYVEHAAENLQFFLWYQDYQRRFDAARLSDRELAPEWTTNKQAATLQDARADSGSRKQSRFEASTGANMFMGTDFENQSCVKISEARQTLISPHISHGSNSFRVTDSLPSLIDDKGRGSGYSDLNPAQQTAEEAFEAIGLKQPFTIQPFRQEIHRVIATYLVEGAPRELNISAMERLTVLKALNYTTHPSALTAVQNSVEILLRRQSHPNFIRWAICNGNLPRVIFARGLGISLVTAGFATAILLTMSSKDRGLRALAVIPWFFGYITLICAWKGLCVVMHGTHSRHVRPWELFDGADIRGDTKASFEVFGMSNSYEDEPWLVSYKKRKLLRRILERQVWVQEPALRRIQDAIFLQSIILSAIISAVLTIVFVVVPGGRYY